MITSVWGALQRQFTAQVSDHHHLLVRGEELGNAAGRPVVASAAQAVHTRDRRHNYPFRFVFIRFARDVGRVKRTYFLFNNPYN